MSAALQLLLQRSGMAFADLRDKSVLLLDGTLDLVAVVPIIGKGSVHVGERDGRILVHDLVRRHTQLLVPNHHILYANAMAGDAGLWPARSVDYFNVLADHISHRSVLSPQMKHASWLLMIIAGVQPPGPVPQAVA